MRIDQLETEDYEDILTDSLEFLGGKRVVDEDIIRYGPLRLTVAPKEGKASTLLADHLFSPALFLAERIERGLIDERGRTVLELGSGTALPSLLLATLPNPPLLVLVTDYPDAGILGNVKNNVDRNADSFNQKCVVKCHGYDWGTDPSPLLKILPDGESGFDTLILSDLLHFYDAHPVLVSSIISLLKKSPSSQVHVGAGSYTKPHVCDNFLALGKQAGLQFEEFQSSDEDKGWNGSMSVSGLDKEALALRKGACRYWVGKWA
ncbi:hypothetical protein BDQ12DRAFT_652333 [Crucibulum laeve]|uniref:Methyltransferase-domain-containing protein n=1 Tax=Crucibulum laeve TaxID=68775 RepID=A0A5C3M1N5_9AGAR|nr:hypothetical protein BDQ12DRAFT_652333 [Crucibulum laeve]